MSFWKDVAELRDTIKLKLAAGYGTRSLNEAMKDMARRSAVPAEPREVEKGLKKVPPQLAELLQEVSPGQQLRMTAEEYRKLTKRE
jgi:hypothetical protein